MARHGSTGLFPGAQFVRPRHHKRYSLAKRTSSEAETETLLDIRFAEKLAINSSAIRIDTIRTFQIQGFTDQLQQLRVHAPNAGPSFDRTRCSQCSPLAFE